MHDIINFFDADDIADFSFTICIHNKIIWLRDFEIDELKHSRDSANSVEEFDIDEQSQTTVAIIFSNIFSVMLL